MGAPTRPSSPRLAEPLALVGDKIVIAGGQANHELVPQTEVFDGTKWTNVAPIPTPAIISPRSPTAATTTRSAATHCQPTDLGALERYDPTAGRSTQLPDLPTPRGGLAAALVGTQIVTAGGESPTGVFDNVEAFDIATSTWSILPPMKTPRHGLALL